jgi:proteasome lid subunit RPN8/RPN11
MGPYKDFDECVRKNANKDNPKRYCGYIRARTENREAGELREALDEIGLPDFVIDAEVEMAEAAVREGVGSRLDSKVNR